MKSRLSNAIAWGTGISVAIVCAAGFTLSFRAQCAVVAQNGIADAGHAWLYPVAIDGAILAFGLSALLAALEGKRHRLYFGLVLAWTGVSIALNAAADHELSVPWKVAIHAIPPLSLAMALHTLLTQVGSRVTKLEKQAQAIVAKEQRLLASVKPTKDRRKEARLEKVKALADVGKSAIEIARACHISKRQAHRDLAEIKAA